MKVSIQMIDTRDGNRQVINSGFDYSNLDGLLFQWLEGNFGCDCNRSIFMYPEEESKHLDCNIEENVIQVEWIQDIDTGEILWKQEES